MRASNITADGLTVELFEQLLTCMSGLPFYINISMYMKVLNVGKPAKIVD